MLRAEGVAVAQEADHVKTAWVLPRVVRCQPGPGRVRENTLFGRGYGRRRAAVPARPPSFDLHENQFVAVAADQVQLHTALPPVAVQQRETRAQQQRCGGIFTGLA